MRRPFALLSSVALFSILPINIALTQAPTCSQVVPPSMGANTAWAQGAHVEVTMTGFSASQQTAIQNVLANWSGAGNSGVTFVVVTNTTGDNPYLLFSNATPSDPNRQGETSGQGNGSNRTNAFVSINPGITNMTAFSQTVSHEIGHTFGLNDCGTCPANSSAMTNNVCCGLNATGGSVSPTACDHRGVNNNGYSAYQPPPCQPSGPPPSTAVCPNASWNRTLCQWDCRPSPIVIDIDGNGFDLTNAENGVNFDIDNNGVRNRIAWTSANSDDAWLALDRNGNGRIDSGAELFGNFTAQPPPPSGKEKNGFLALAEFDTRKNGGNQDDQIDRRDAIFHGLRLWRDVNHNGISERSELFTLSELGVAVIELDYRESKRFDVHGNWFKYRARVIDVQGAQIGRWAWDVFLVTQ